MASSSTSLSSARTGGHQLRDVPLLATLDQELLIRGPRGSPRRVRRPPRLSYSVIVQSEGWTTLCRPPPPCLLQSGAYDPRHAVVHAVILVPRGS